MENTRMTIPDKFKNSIYNFKEYVYFVNEPTGRAFVYLLILTLVFGSLSVIKPIINFNSMMDALSQNVQEAVPDFTFGSGELSIDAKMPIITGDEYTVIIDTRTNADESVIDGFSHAVGFFRDKMVQKNQLQVQTYPYSMFQEFHFTKSDLVRVLPAIHSLGIAAIIVFKLLGYFLINLIASLITAIAGMMMSKSMKLKYSFSTLYSLALYSITVPTVLKFIVGLLEKTVFGFWAIYLAIAIIYVYLGLKEIKRINIASEQDAALY